MCKRIFASQTNPNDGVPFYKIGTIGETPDSYISKELFEKYRREYSYPKPGEIMLTCAGTIGRCFQYDGSPSYFQDSNIVWIDNPKGKITNDFLFYALQRHDWRMLNTTTITRLYNDDIRSIEIAYPSNKEEQEKVCRLIFLIDQRIEIQRKTIEDSSVSKKMIETSFFESLSPTDIAKVGDVVDYERPDQYIVKSDRYKNAGIPVLTANKGFILGYTDEKDGIYAKGAAVIFDDFTEASQYVDFPFKVKSSAIKILTPKTNQINSLYIQAYLEYLKLESSEHKRHYLSDIVGYDFPIPSQEDFSSFIGTLATVIQWIEVLKKEQIVLQRLRQALLASLFA